MALNKSAFHTLSVALILALVMWLTYVPLVANASNGAGSYLSSRITSTVSSSTAAVSLVNTQAVFGSVIILATSSASTTATTTIKVYDGKVSTGTTTATLIAEFPNSVPMGVWTFDVGVSQGLLIDVPKGFNGQFIVTYRL